MPSNNFSKKIKLTNDLVYIMEEQLTIKFPKARQLESALN